MPPASHRFDAIGTSWQIDTPSELEPDETAAISALVEHYDAAYSRFRSDSLVSSIARQPGEYTLPASAAALCRVYTALYACTAGALTPFVGNSLEHLGYDAGYSLRPGPSAVGSPVWDETIHWNGQQLRTEVPVLLDIGAAGKGQLVDLIAALLKPRHCEYVIDAGGDMVHHGSTPVRVALEHPYDSAKALGVIDLNNRALCASASNRRAWGDRLHHILDGRTGAPVETVVASWVLAEDALSADALATALFLVGADALQREFSFDFVRIFSDGRAEFSAGFKGALFS